MKVESMKKMNEKEKRKKKIVELERENAITKWRIERRESLVGTTTGDIIFFFYILARLPQNVPTLPIDTAQREKERNIERVEKGTRDEIG